MKIETISEQEYQVLEKDNVYRNFQQTTSWAKLKASTGWKAHYFMARNQNDIYTWVILEKTYMKLFKMFYSQKGLAIDYENEELVKCVYEYMKNWLKKQKGMMLMIDPNISYEPKIFQEIGIKRLNEIIPNSINVGVNCFYVKKLEGSYEDLYKEFSKRNKYSIKKSKRYVWDVNILNIEQIERFYLILKHTAERKHFSIRSLEYFQAMYNAFQENVFFITLTLNVQKSIEQLTRKMDIYNKKLEHMKNDNKRIELLGLIKQCEKEIERLYELNDKVDVCCAMYILDKPKELVHVFGGNVKEYIDFEGQYYLHDYMMHFAINEGYMFYNFYGCENNGVLLENVAYMKEGYRGEYVKTIGDYMIVNSLWKVKWFYRCRSFYLWLNQYK